MKKLGVLCLFLMAAFTAAGQDLRRDLKKFAETPAVTGYEQALGAEIVSRLKPWNPRADNLGNVIVTVGSGAPSRLLVAPMDEPGYVVSGITEDGLLRVQRLPQAAAPPLFDQLHAAQPVQIGTRKGKWVPGVIAGLSTHLQPNRVGAPRGNHPDEIYVDIGAANVAGVRAAGVDLLDPIAFEHQAYEMGLAMMTAMGIGDKYGAAALVETLRGLDAAKMKGTLTVAFVAQQGASSRGLDRLVQQVRADEVIYVGRMVPRRAALGAGRRGAGAAAPSADTPRKEPGSGVLVGTEADGSPAGFAAEIKKLAEEWQIPVAGEATAPLPRVSYTQGPVMPERFAHLAVATAWPHTPGEWIDLLDVEKLVAALKAYVVGGEQHGGLNVAAASALPPAVAPPALPKKPTAAPATTEILRRLVEAYGVSGEEGAVRETVAALLPSWAKWETDDHGNLILRAKSAAKPRNGAPRIAFVAHMDEIGYIVRSVADDGRLVVQSCGGAIPEFFAGHALFVHTAQGIRPGVLELPAGWDQPGFEWPRAAPATAPGAATVEEQAAQAPQYRVDVGARSAAEVGQLGIKVGDALTVPKKYRQLAGARANGRSFDDRVGCTALLAAVWALGPELARRQVTFVWSTEEEVGLRGAKAAADRMAAAGEAPDYVFAVDTFVTSDSPLESKRFADAQIGKGFVIRAVDNSSIAPRSEVDKLVALARANQIPVQYGVTGGGNDGAVFLRHGTRNVPISWPLRYSHSPGEVVDTRDVESLAKIVAAIARSW